MHRRFLQCLLGFLVLCTSTVGAQNDDPRYAVLGARIFIADHDAASRFYKDLLGFAWVKMSADAVPLEDAHPRIVLSTASSQVPETYQLQPRAIVNLQVPNLWATMNNLEAEGVSFATETINRNGIGLDATVVTPDGDTHYLMEVRANPQSDLKDPKIFNLELHVSDLDRATDFYTNVLGFEKRTDAYRPIMPLWHTGGDFAVVLNGDNSRPVASPRDHGKYVGTVLLFATDDLDRAHDSLAANQMASIVAPPHLSGSTRRMLFADADGIVNELWELPEFVRQMTEGREGGVK